VGLAPTAVDLVLLSIHKDLLALILLEGVCIVLHGFLLHLFERVIPVCVLIILLVLVREHFEGVVDLHGHHFGFLFIVDVLVGVPPAHCLLLGTVQLVG